MWKGSCLNVRVDESGDRLVARGTLPRHDHHLCFDSVGWKDCKKIIRQSSFDGVEHE